MTEEEVLKRVTSVVAKVLNPGGGDAPAEGDPNLASWDSLKHMNVVLAVENEFSIEFDGEELQKLNSIQLLASSVSKHLTSGS